MTAKVTVINHSATGSVPAWRVYVANGQDG